jgi:hypothetical protein
MSDLGDGLMAAQSRVLFVFNLLARPGRGYPRPLARGARDPPRLHLQVHCYACCSVLQISTKRGDEAAQ